MDDPMATDPGMGPTTHAPSPAWASVRDVLKPLTSAAALGAFVAGFAILSYLKSIGRPDMMQYALGSKEAFVLIFCVAVFVATLYFLSFFLCLVVTHAALGAFDNAADVPSRYQTLVPSLGVAWLIMVGSFFCFSSEMEANWATIGNIAFVVASILTAIAGPGEWRHLLSLRSLRSLRSRVKDKGWNLLNRAIFGLLIAASSLISTGAVFFFVRVNPQVGDSPLGLHAMMLVMAVALPGTLASSVLTVSYIRGRDMQKARRGTALVVMSIVVLSTLIFPDRTLFPVAVHALRISGVVSTQMRTYLLEDGDLAIAREMGFIEPRAGLKAVAAYEWFHLGDRAILCTRAPNLFGTRSPSSALACPIEPACMDVSGDLRTISLR